MSETQTNSNSEIVTGTPDRPNFKRHPIALVLSLVAYAAFMAALIVWAVQLHRSHR